MVPVTKHGAQTPQINTPLIGLEACLSTMDKRRMSSASTSIFYPLGKTKVISKVKNAAGMVVIRSKDRITAGDGARAHDMAGKSVISTSTNCSVFELLNKAGTTT